MRKLVLFVDDDPKILAGLRRALRLLRNQWEMVFTEGGEAALEQCARMPFDAVISDARMPGMEGPTLLGKVRELYPDAARFILSGHCNHDSVLNCVAVAHQFLNKPCEPESLTTALRAVFEMRQLFPDKTTRQKLSRVSWLPSPSRLWDELAAESPKTAVGDLAAIIGRDVGMSAKVVQLVSSGFFGSPQRVASPTEAVRFLGLETVCSLFAQSAELATAVDSRRDEALERINAHSLAVAAAARGIAATLTDDRVRIGDAYLAGMLHEMGSLALDGGEGGGGDCRGSMTVPPSGDASALDPGAYLAALWGLPDPVVQAIAFHRVPSLYRGESLVPLTSVHVANAMLEAASEFGESDQDRLAMDYLEQAACVEYLGRWRAICDEFRLEGVAG